MYCNSRVTFYTIPSSTGLWVVFSLSTLYFSSVHVHTFLSFNLQQLFFICSNFVFFCINFILFAATFSFAACPLWAAIIIWFSTLQNNDPWLTFYTYITGPDCFKKGIMLHRIQWIKLSIQWVALFNVWTTRTWWEATWHFEVRAHYFDSISMVKGVFIEVD